MKVFAGGLPWAVDNVRLKEAFSQHGKVVDARVIFDKESGKSRGFGFVTFADEQDALSLIAQGSMELDGRTVRIDYANEKRQQRGERGERRGPRSEEYDDRMRGGDDRRERRRRREGREYG